MVLVKYTKYLSHEIGAEERFLIAWEAMTKYMGKEKGALGSRVFQSKMNSKVYYITSCWPDETTRKASWRPDEDMGELPRELQQALDDLKETDDPKLDTPEPETVLDNINDVAEIDYIPEDEGGKAKLLRDLLT